MLPHNILLKAYTLKVISQDGEWCNFYVILHLYHFWWLDSENNMKLYLITTAPASDSLYNIYIPIIRIYTQAYIICDYIIEKHSESVDENFLR